MKLSTAIVWLSILVFASVPLSNEVCADDHCGPLNRVVDDHSGVVIWGAIVIFAGAVVADRRQRRGQ